jgi:amidophosphoribosyltransferase
MPSRKELVAHGRDSEAIAAAIGADLVIFQTLPDLVESVRHLNPSIEQFDCSVFTGEYVTGGVDEEYLLHVESLRADCGGKAENSGENGEVINRAATQETKEPPSESSNSSVNGDDTVGLHNSWHQG